MAKDLAIILNDGSVNSAVCTALAAQKYRPVMLHVEMAASPGSRARAAYEEQVGHFKPYREQTLNMHWLSGFTPPPHRTTPADPRTPAPLGPKLAALLPLVAAAGRFAGYHQAAAVYLGLRVGQAGEELAQATEYAQIWTELLQLPCGLGEVEVQLPLLEMEPWQVIDLGFQVAAPLEKTWSCMEETGDPCWACRGCRAREQAFQQAVKLDPLRAARRV